MTVREKYHGQDQVHTANGPSMEISHVGQSIIKTPHKNLVLNEILHAPNASEKLLSVHCIALVNNVFLEFHPYFFLFKDQVTKQILHRGFCVDGLYSLLPKYCKFNKQVYGAIKLSAERWHSRLGHPSFATVHQILGRHKLPVVGERDSETICDSCQRAKSHQLPYPVSSSVSTKPLQLIFSDVWSPAPTSVGRHSYYVSFVDDYSKYTWINLLKNVLMCFKFFTTFKPSLNASLIAKSLPCSQTEVVSMKS